jgi:hypothetical protein
MARSEPVVLIEGYRARKPLKGEIVAKRGVVTGRSVEVRQSGSSSGDQALKLPKTSSSVHIPNK